VNLTKYECRLRKEFGNRACTVVPVQSCPYSRARTVVLYSGDVTAVPAKLANAAVPVQPCKVGKNGHRAMSI